MKMIFLTGMPGAGKSYWAGKLAGKYDLRLIDLDTHICEKESLSIPEIFGQYGEPGFRERECAALMDVIKQADSKTIVSCGGGTPCFGNNQQLMKDVGIVIYLQAEIESLFQYLKDDAQPRPMLPRTGNIRVFLEEMLNNRKGMYEQANYILPVEGLSLSSFDKILENV